MFNEIAEKIAKTNEQRCVMALTLVNVMKQSNGASIDLRSAIAASLIDMLDNHMLNEDRDLIRVLNEGIDSVCEDAKQYGVKDLRSALRQTIQTSKQQIEEHLKRVNEGSNILNQINLN
jgi:hypothetical protein